MLDRRRITLAPPVGPPAVLENEVECLDVVEVTMVRGESVDPWLSVDRVVVVMVGEGTGGAITDFDSAQMPSRGEMAIGAVPAPDESPPAPGRGGKDA